METLNSILATIDGYVWNIPLIFTLLFVGILLTVRLGCMQITRLPRAIRFVWRNEKKRGERSFQFWGTLHNACSNPVSWTTAIAGFFVTVFAATFPNLVALFF